MLTKEIDFDNFTLVLSGGGALGVAHLGILEDMEKYQIKPKEVIGTSIGSLIGASLAIGFKQNEIFDLFKKFSSWFSWARISFNGNGLISISKLDKILSDIFGDKKMYDTKIPLKIIATNLITNEIKVFDKNDDILIKDCILASITVPGLIDSKEINGVTYCDGYLCDNLGIEYAQYNDVIASDVISKNSIRKFKSKEEHSILGMINRSTRIMIANQTKRIIDNSMKNIYLLEPDTSEFSMHNYKEIEKIKQKGLNLFTHA